MGIGPIPWTAVMQYAERVGFDRFNTDLFAHVIRSMDAVYLKWAEKERKRTPYSNKE